MYENLIKYLNKRGILLIFGIDEQPVSYACLPNSIKPSKKLVERMKRIKL